MTTSPRRHDLDALRAAAMLLGIVYHAALSFSLGPAWMAEDVSQSTSLFVFQAFVHGFRMPLFMLVSGYFTAMLWRRRGLKALLANRAKRVLLPCLAGLVTVVPAMIFSAQFASNASAERRQRMNPTQASVDDIWTAIRTGEGAALDRWLQDPAARTNTHPQFGYSPLTWACLAAPPSVVERLLEAGAPVGDRNRDGGTALHAAAFLGRLDVVQTLIGRGADPAARNNSGETPLGSAETGLEAVEFIAGALGFKVDKGEVERGRVEVVRLLRSKLGDGAGSKSDPGPGAGSRIFRQLVETPVFILVWFLWFLVWLILLFAVVALLADRFGWRVPGSPWLVTGASMLWLVPLTFWTNTFMSSGSGEFGPDTVMGVIPAPHVLAYYAVFFFFGAAYFDAGDVSGRLGSRWPLLLGVGLLVVFPVALELATGFLGLRDRWVPAALHRNGTLLLQAVYAWMMCLGCIGMFRSLVVRENAVIRYLSDSAYWLYLAHLPPTILLQSWIAGWKLPALLKWTGLSVFLIAVLLLSYQFLVRHTAIGAFLNGPREKPAAGTANAAALSP